MSVLNDIGSKCGMGTIALLSHEDLRSIGLILTTRLAVEVRSFQFYLKYLKKEGLLLISVTCSRELWETGTFPQVP